MYRVAVRRDFIAQHYLIGGDWGAENQKHSHHYVLELELGGETLDQHNYLVDIVEIERQIAGASGLLRRPHAQRPAGISRGRTPPWSVSRASCARRCRAPSRPATSAR